MDRPVKAIGLMSGTSMDGIDVALMETDGLGHCVSLGGASYDYAAADREAIQRAVEAACALEDRNSRDGALGDAEAIVTNRHATAVTQLLEELGVGAEEIQVVGFHGQTVLHRPEERLTVQIGDGEELSKQLGLKVVFDFRAQDVAAGGEGAPFVPIYHSALLRKSKVSLPAVVVNIGGVANVTWVGAAGVEKLNDDTSLLAFDTGPGNALLDDWIAENSGGRFDEGGLIAKSGRVDEAVVQQLLSHPFFELLPPKSLDRNDFSLDPVRGMPESDGAATLAMFTARSISLASRFMPSAPGIWIVCGGGAKNTAIMEDLNILADGNVIAAAELGWNADLIEAEAFAYLAVRSLKGLPLTFPGTTGVPSPQPGGRLA